MIKKMIAGMIALMSVGFCEKNSYGKALINCFAYNAEIESLRKETTPETDNKYITKCWTDSDNTIFVVDTVENSSIWVSQYSVKGEHIKGHHRIKNDILCTDWLGLYEKDSNYPIKIITPKNETCDLIVNGSNGDTWRKIINLKKGDNWMKFFNSRYRTYDSAVVNTARRKALDGLVKSLDTIDYSK